MTGHTLNGSRFIKRTIRPPRIAIVVSSLPEVENFISIASLSWGGRHFLAIPSKDGAITNEWYDVLQKYNPDEIRTFCKLSPDTHERLWKSRFVVEKIYPQTELKIKDVSEEWNGVKHIPEFIGQPIINLMLIDDFYDTSKGKPHLIYIPLQSNFDIYYKARFGVIDEDEWLRWQNLYISPVHQKTRPDELIENADISFDKDVLSYIHQKRNVERNDEFISLIDYSLTRLGQVHVKLGSVIDPPSKSETNHIVVVSKEVNAEDFCWYWAIRGQRYGVYDRNLKGPVWISLEMLTSTTNLLQDLFINTGNVYIISKSTNQKDIPALGDQWFFQTENLQEYYNEHYYIGDTIDVPVNLVNNETEHKFDGAESLKHLDPFRHQFAMLDIQIPGIVLPKIRDFRFGDLYIANYWTTKSGLTRHIISNRNEIAKLRIPTPWDVISSFADAAGYRLEISDKGSIGNELIRLIGGERNLWILSHPAVLTLLLEMSSVNKINEIRKLIRDNIQDNAIRNRLLGSLPRKTLNTKVMSFSAIKKLLRAEIDHEKLDDKTSTLIIRWLLDRGLLLQGEKISCAICHTENWIPVNKFDSRIVCSGCMNEIRNPFSVERVEWDYQINTLVSAEIDQGLLIHLLTGFHVFDMTIGLRDNVSVYGSYYGLQFIGQDTQKEIDIAFLINGRLAIGECKVSGREFSKQMIREYIDFANEIHASEVILSCLEHVDELEKLIESIDHDIVEITVLGKSELSMQFTGLLLEQQLKVDRNDTSPIDRSAKYMQHLQALDRV